MTYLCEDCAKKDTKIVISWEYHICDKCKELKRCVEVKEEWNEIPRNQ
jgi:hypothetical protein